MYSVRRRRSVFHVLNKNELFVKVSAVAAHTNTIFVLNEGVLIIKKYEIIYLHYKQKQSIAHLASPLWDKHTISL